MRMMKKEANDLAGNNCNRDNNGEIVLAEDGRKRALFEFQLGHKGIIVFSIITEVLAVTNLKVILKRGAKKYKLNFVSK